MAEPQAEAIAFLADPRRLGVARVDRISTHGAHVFLAGDRAYKLKRAVVFPFMDFSTAEKRRAALQAEFEINRPAAPSIYHGLHSIRRRESGDVGFDGDGDVLDWVLEMQRFDQEAMLDNMASRGKLTPELMETLADTVAGLHRNAPLVHRDEPLHFASLLDDLLNGLSIDFPDHAAAARLARDLRSAEARCGDHLLHRSREGFVRRCHGDLHLRNIVMVEDRPVPVDALEFDPSLASGDTFYDLAFLVMDLEARGLRSLAWTVLNRYVETTGDIGGLKAFPLFLATRAVVRARVALLRGKAENGSIAAEARAEAETYLRTAQSFLVPATAQVIAIGGLSGTGKSAAARLVAPSLAPIPGAIVLRSDVTRKRLHGVPALERLTPDAYTPAAGARVYASLGIVAERGVRAGWSVIVDAVFARPDERTAIEALARRHGAPFRGFWLEAPVQVRRARIAGRRNDASDATVNLVDTQEAYDLGEMTWRRIAADGTLDQTVARLIQALRA